MLLIWINHHEEALYEMYVFTHTLPFHIVSHMEEEREKIKRIDPEAMVSKSLIFCFNMLFLISCPVNA